MKILLTGGAGYIGSHVSLALLDSGHEVTIIDNLTTGNKSLIPNKAKFINCNINDKRTVGNLLKIEKYDLLMHFAGYIQVEESVKKPKKYFENNTENAKILFKTCEENNLKNIIFSSTAAAYGNPKDKKKISEDSLLKPLNPYGESKIKTEEYIRENRNLNFIILRYFNVAGADPQMRSGLISKKATHLIKIACEASIGKRNDLTIFGNDYPTKDGTGVRDYIHVMDVADAHVATLDYLLRNGGYLPINLGTGNGVSVLELIQAFEKASGHSIPWVFGPRRKGDAAECYADPALAKRTLGWSAKRNLDSMCSDMWRWQSENPDGY